MKRDRDVWLSCVAAALGVSIAECNKHAGDAQKATAAPVPTYTIPPPHDTVCSVSVVPPERTFVFGVAGEDGRGACYGPAPIHPSANCGPKTGPEIPCADKKPWKPNLRAVVRARGFEQAELEAPLRDALAKILPTLSGPWQAHVTLEVDASGKLTVSPNAPAPLSALTLPHEGTVTIDLTST